MHSAFVSVKIRVEEVESLLLGDSVIVFVVKYIKYKRMPRYEDPDNSTVAIGIKDGNNKSVCIMGIYRQWKKGRA